MENFNKKISIFSAIALFTFIIMVFIGCYTNDDKTTKDYFADETLFSINIDVCLQDCKEKYEPGKERRVCKKKCKESGSTDTTVTTDVDVCLQDCKEKYEPGKERKVCKKKCKESEITDNSSDPIVLTFDNAPKFKGNKTWRESDVRIQVVKGSSAGDGDILICESLKLNFRKIKKSIKKVEIDIENGCDYGTYAELLGLSNPIKVYAKDPWDVNEKFETISLSTKEAKTIGLKIFSYESFVYEVRLYSK
jgi:hypothetical protein